MVLPSLSWLLLCGTSGAPGADVLALLRGRGAPDSIAVTAPGCDRVARRRAPTADVSEPHVPTAIADPVGHACLPQGSFVATASAASAVCPKQTDITIPRPTSSDRCPSGYAPDMPTSSTEPGSESAATPVAVVTGASRGLGFLLACELADRGHNLVVNARSADGLAAPATGLRSRGVQVDEVAGDVSDPEVAARLVTAATGRFGRLDVLVANAGVIQVGPVQAMRPEDFAEAMDVMYWGVVRPTLAAMPALRAHHGRVLVVTSIGGKLPPPHLLPYTAAKHAAVGFAEGLRVEAARDGVSVTVAVPGLMRTGSTGNALFTGDRPAERGWFTVADSLPGLSMDAEKAARRLVRAALRGRPEITLTLPAKLGARVHALAPSTTLRVLSLVNRLLPGPQDTGAPQPGHTAEPRSRWYTRLTGPDRAAARRWHQHDDPTPVSAG